MVQLLQDARRRNCVDLCDNLWPPAKVHERSAHAQAVPAYAIEARNSERVRPGCAVVPRWASLALSCFVELAFTVSRQPKRERFAMLPLRLMEHPAVTTLTHAAYRVLTVFAAGYKGNNNGLLVCTDKWMRNFGIVSRDTTYRAIRELTERGLIAMTRPGIKQRRVATQYRVTWLPLHYMDGKLLGRFSSPSYDYLHWTPTVRAKKKVPNRSKATAEISAEFQSDDRISISPTVGPKSGASSPTVSCESADPQSDDREYLRLSPGLHSSAPGSIRPSVLPSHPSSSRSRSRIEKVLRLPKQEMTDAEVAKVSGESIDLVKEIRKSLEPRQ